VMQCLEKKAADRPQTAEELLRQLDQVLTPSGGMTPTDTRPYQTAGMRRAKRRQLIIGVAVVAGLGVIGILGWRGWQARGVPIVADRVVIAPFRNETGKAELADLGWRIAEQIGGTVAREGVTDPVPISAVREHLVGAVATISELKQLSKQTGAGLVVSGNYHARGDLVEVRTEIVRMPAGTRLYDLTPIVLPSTDPAMLDRVAEQVTLALQLTKDWGDDYRWGQDYRMPTSLAAYKEWVTGLAGGGEPRDAFVRVLVLDSTWPQARLSWIRTFGNAEQDSLIRLEQRAAGNYLAGDRDDLKVISARLDGDYERVYRVLKQRFSRSPAEYRASLGDAANTTRRFHEALRLGAERDSSTFLSRRTGVGALLDAHVVWDLALHSLGRYQDEVQLAQELRREMPELPHWPLVIEGRAFAGLHQVAQVDQVVAAAEAISDWTWITIYMELQAHGLPDESRRLCSRTADLLLKRKDDFYRNFLGEALECAGREKEMLAVYDAQMKAHPDQRMLYLRGWLAARAGNRKVAYAYVDSILAEPKPRAPLSGPDDDALVILIKLGDTTRAIAQFQETYRRGDLRVVEDLWWHRHPYYNPIRNHPAVLAVTRPKD